MHVLAVVDAEFPLATLIPPVPSAAGNNSPEHLNPKTKYNKSKSAETL
jgi:hypothetical protein